MIVFSYFSFWGDWQHATFSVQCLNGATLEKQSGKIRLTLVWNGAPNHTYGWFVDFFVLRYDQYVVPGLDALSRFLCPKAPLPAATASLTPPLLVDPTSSRAWAMREGSSKLARLDHMLRGFRANNQRALVFCQISEMMTLLQVFLHKHGFKFVCVDVGLTASEKLAALSKFNTSKDLLVCLVSTSVSPPPTPPSAGRVTSNQVLCGEIFTTDTKWRTERWHLSKVFSLVHMVRRENSSWAPKPLE